MKAGKKFEIYFPAILFCETLRRKERKDLCYDGARKILWAIERVCSIQRLAYPGCEEEGVCRRASFHVKLEGYWNGNEEIDFSEPKWSVLNRGLVLNTVTEYFAFLWYFLYYLHHFMLYAFLPFQLYSLSFSRGDRAFLSPLSTPCWFCMV